MNKKWFLFALFLLLLCSGVFAQKPTTSELLQKGIYLQETVGDLDGAIRIYKQVVRMAEESRANAAQAEYRLGVCLRKKGRKDEAARTFARLIQEYPEQTGLVAQARGQAEPEPILLWEVGSPYEGDTPKTTVPAELEQSAEAMGRKLQVRGFPAIGFAQIFFDAFQQNQEPDILVINNYGIIDGLPAQPGFLTGEAALPGIGSNPKVRASLIRTTESLSRLAGPEGGWQFLLSTSRNYEAAKSLVLRSPECSLRGPWQAVPGELHTVAATVAPAYIEEKKPLLEPFEDKNRLNTEMANSRSRVVSETKECGYLGNDKLAFMPMILRYESPHALGWINLLLILHKQQDQWRLLAASTDPVSNKRFLSQIPRLVSSISKASDPGKEPFPAKLLVPDEGKLPEPEFGERFGSFSWQPSASADVVAEIVEFAYNDDARLYFKFRREEQSAESQLSAGGLWTTGGLWRWRVWSISNSGSVSFSEARSFKN